MTHDELIFQRINGARLKHVSALRIALKAAGLVEASLSAPFLSPNGIGVLQQQQGATPGFSIERVIEAAPQIRAALEPFDPATYPKPATAPQLQEPSA